MTQRRVIFLDIDGVLAHFGSNERLDPAAVERLNQLVNATGADVILTSSWRDTFGVNETERRLKTAGFTGSITGAVPCLVNGTRCDEIDAFLERLEVPARFVILDDVPVEEHLKPNAIQVDDFVGLTALDVAAAVRILVSPGRPP